MLSVGYRNSRIRSFQNSQQFAGQKKAREIWFLAKLYTAKEALEMGLINHVTPLAQLESTTVDW